MDSPSGLNRQVAGEGGSSVWLVLKPALWKAKKLLGDKTLRPRRKKNEGWVNGGGGRAVGAQ